MNKLGVDLGNVIIDHLTFGTTTDYVLNGDYNKIPPVKGSLLALKHLNIGKFRDNVFVVYNATDVAEYKIITWLQNHDFFKITGIQSNKIIRSKGKRNKLSACLENEINHFIDDRLEVLEFLSEKISNLFLFRGQEMEIEKFKESLFKVKLATNWEQLLNMLKTDE